MTQGQTNEEAALEWGRLVRAHPEHLAKRNTALARMCVEDGLSQAEVARRTGLSEGTVRTAVRMYGAAIRAASLVNAGQGAS